MPWVSTPVNVGMPWVSPPVNVGRGAGCTPWVEEQAAPWVEEGTQVVYCRDVRRVPRWYIPLPYIGEPLDQQAERDYHTPGTPLLHAGPPPSWVYCSTAGNGGVTTSWAQFFEYSLGSGSFVSQNSKVLFSFVSPETASFPSPLRVRNQRSDGTGVPRLLAA